MAKQPQRLPIHDVRRLSVREVVDMWSEDANIHPGTLGRELRRFLLNQELNWRDGERIDPDTPDDDLPGLETLVDKPVIEMFCEKKGWARPTFWFPPVPAEVRPRGRPTEMPAIVQEFEDRLARGETEGTISDEARAILHALRERGVQGLPKAKTIQGHIRDDYNAWKDRQNL